MQNNNNSQLGSSIDQHHKTHLPCLSISKIPSDGAESTRQNTNEKVLGALVRSAKLDNAYFNNPEHVRSDLHAFLDAYNSSESLSGSMLSDIQEVTRNRPWPNTLAKLSNGSEVSWDTYLLSCSRALTGKITVEALKHLSHSSVIKHLKRLTGCKVQELNPLPSGYFQDARAVERDLKLFMNSYNASVKDPEAILLGLSDLCTNRPDRNICIELSDGMEITWYTYLSFCSRALVYKTAEESLRDVSRRDAIQYLKQVAGIEQHVELKKEYFDNPGNVKTDLYAFLRAYNIDKVHSHQLKSIDDMSTHRPNRKTKTTLSSGQEMTWQTYLSLCRRVHINMNRKASLQELSLSASLRCLKEVIGLKVIEYQCLTMEYFNNLENVKSDLKAFLESHNSITPNNHLTDISDISTESPKPQTRSILSDGREMRWNTYLRTYSSLLTGKIQREAVKEVTTSAALKDLKNRLTIHSSELLVLTQDYFHNPLCVKHDLDAYISAYNCNAGPCRQIARIDDMLVNFPTLNTRAVLADGRELSWLGYLQACCRAMTGKSYQNAKVEMSCLTALQMLKFVAFQGDSTTWIDEL